MRSAPVVLLAVIGSAAAGAPAQGPATATIQLPPGLVVTSTTSFDVDGDRRSDLVLACRDPKTGQRSVRVHLRQAAPPWFASAPTRPPHVVEPDAIAFTFCDCAPNAGAELVLLTAEQVVAVLPDDDGAATYRRLARHDLVWPAADRDLVLPLPAAAIDFDGDGTTDLVLPRPDGWSVLLQGTGDAGERFAHRLELMLAQKRSAVASAVQARGGGSGGELELRLGNDQEAAPLVRVATRTAPSLLVDLDGDGRSDLACWRNGRVSVGLQTTAGAIVRRDVALPLPTNRLQLFDPAFDVQLAPLDGDARADLLLTTSARRGDDVEVRVDRFKTRDDGTWADEPDSRLRVQTLAQAPQLVDVDGDGDLDLALVSVRTSAMRALTGDAPTALDAQLSVFRNDGERFLMPALLVQALPLAAGSERLEAPFLVVRAGSRPAPADVLLHVDGALERRALEPSGDRLRLGAAVDRVPVPPDARLVAIDRDAAEVCIVTDGEVRHVRFR